MKEEIVHLYKSGLRQKAIAERLGLTRNVVSGVVYRLGLRPTTLKPPDLVFPTRGCQWIEGDVRGAETRFCGAAVDPGEPNPWCPVHRGRVYVRQPTSK